MKHSEIQEKILALYDGPLTEKERPLVEEHLRGCSACQRAVDEWKRTSAVLFNIPTFSEVEEDRFVADALLKVYAIPSPESFSWKTSLAWLAPLAGSAALAAWVYLTVWSGAAGLNQQPFAEAFSVGGPAQSFTSFDAAAESTSDRFVHQVVYKYEEK